MDFASIVEEVAHWPVEERIRLAGALWDGIADSEAFPELTKEQAADLDRRIADADAHPERSVTWEEVEARLRGRR